MTDYLKSFIIGSSWPVAIFYFYPVSQYRELINVSYRKYTMIAPIFLGLLNVFGLYLSNHFGLSFDRRFLLTGLIGAIFIALVITYFKVYNFLTQKRWYQQYIYLIIMYFFIFNIVIRSIEYLLK